MIREATLNDLDVLAVLFDEYRVFYEKESDVPGALKFLKERLSQAQSVIYVSISEATPTGFVQLYPLFSSTRMKRLWLLNDLYVKDQYRGLGHGEALIEKAKELAIKTNSCGLILETAKTNVVGNNLYVKTNFDLDKEHNFLQLGCYIAKGHA